MTHKRSKDFAKWWKDNRPQVLQETLNEFREAYLNRKKTGEREAYIRAIRALGGVLLHLEEPLDLSDGDPAYMWFMDLIRNLEDLDAGVVPPVFRCPVRRKGVSTVEWMRRVWVVYAIELLHATGIRYRAAARRVIACKLHGASEKEVLSWCAEFRKRHVKNREAAFVYEGTMEAIGAASAQELQRSIAIELPELNSPKVGE